MNEHTEEPENWPLRDWSTRLRPPGRTEAPGEEEPGDDEVQEPNDEAVAAEVLYEDEELEKEPSDAVVDEEVQEETAGAWLQPGSGSVSPGSGSASEELLIEDEQEEPVAVEEHVEGELRIPDGYVALEGSPTGHRRTVAIVVSRFNGDITNRLLDAALTELDEAGVTQDAILVMPVPGAFELPIAAMALAKTRRYSCVIALGCVIRGETPHFDFVAGEAASGLQLAGIETGVPVSFGVLTCDTAEQAEARIDRGAVAARSALEMADAFAQLRTAAARQ
jgi:6,7-dimethyl-8-ribityllumazine synthase